MSWVEAELREQPVALERFLAAESANASGIVRDLLREDVRYLLIVSRGSSSNVARYLQYLFGAANQLPVAFATPSLYTVYDTPPQLGPAAVIGISQSGASPDVVAVLDEARQPAAADARDHQRPGVSPRQRGRLDSAAARRQGARRRSDEDVPELDRSGRAPLCSGRPRTAGRAACDARQAVGADRPVSGSARRARAVSRRRRRQCDRARA